MNPCLCMKENFDTVFYWLQRMKRKKPKRAATAETSSGTEVCENVPTTITDIVQDIIRKRLSQTSLPPEITGFEQERK